MKYIRRSKTVEATMNIRKLYDSSVSYYEAEHASATGTILARQFPTTAAVSPALGACCTQTGKKCAPNAAYWNTNTTWPALNFSVDDPFYYSYTYTSAGTDNSASFNADAQGDLNCDGKYSLFRRSGSVTTNGDIAGGAGIYSVNDIE
jgi:hypothetical protein